MTRSLLWWTCSIHSLRFPFASVAFSHTNHKYQDIVKNPTSRPSAPDTSFYEEVVSWLSLSNITFYDYMTEKSPFPIISLGKEEDSYNVGLHIVSTPKTVEISPNLCKKLTDDAELPFKTIIHLHEDVWINKNKIVKARIAARVNLTKKNMYARKSNLKRINVSTAMEFLNENHLWGATKAKFSYGLFDKNSDELIAVATFSPRRHVQRGVLSPRPYRSHELIRYCSKRDERVVGGITKLLAGFCRDLAPDDVVTCIDRDWGDGSGWESIGFEKVHVMPPLVMAVAEDGLRRYFVGAGIGCVDGPHERRSEEVPANGRQGIDLDLFQDLSSVSSDLEALECIALHNLYPVYDSGVERRMLLVHSSKLDAQANERRKELGLEKINVPLDTTASILWKASSPCFPSYYYSKNTGINFLLERALR